MSVLKVSSLVASVGAREILKGIDLEVRSGEVHAIMGPNGSGKSTLSHVLMGKSGYNDVAGSIAIDDVEIAQLSTAQRAAHGLFLAMQYPIEVPGVALDDVLREALQSAGKEASDVSAQIRQQASRIGFPEQFLNRPLNVDLSGGEKKRNETLMMSVLRPKFAILDEIDSGLDVDALRAVANRVEEATKEDDLGVVAITHYSRLLDELKPDVVHVMVNGRIVASGGSELASQIEAEGYKGFVSEAESASDDSAQDANQDSASTRSRPKIVDPWGDPLAGM